MGTGEAEGRRGSARRAEGALAAGPLTPLLLALAGLACASASPPGPPPPAPAEAEAEEAPALPPVEAERLEEEVEERRRLLEPGELPPIPQVDGPLRIRVRYPAPRQRLAVRDSNFLFGTVGTGRARLWIDGEPVPVEPNGAFLAWLPVPASSGRGDTAVYRLRAETATESDTARLPVLLPPRPFVGPPGRVWLDTMALAREAVRWALPDEPLSIAVRGAPGAEAWFEAGGIRHPLHPDPGRSPGDSVQRYRARVPAGRIWADGCAARAEAGEPPCGAVPGRADSLPVALVATDGRDTVRLDRRWPLRLLEPHSLPVARLLDLVDPEHGRPGAIVGRPTPTGTYRWAFAPGSEAEVDGRRGDRLRLRLAPDLHAWVAFEATALLPPGAPAPRGPVGDLRVEPGPEALTLRLPLRAPLPAAVDQPDARTLRLTLFGAFGETDRAAHGPSDPLLASLGWEQRPGGRYRVTLRLAEPVWGWRLAYERGDAAAYEGLRTEDIAAHRGSDPVLRLDVRRPPRIDRRRPLRGRRIAVDPGHPGAGAYGPTGYYEGEANLAVARKLVRLLAEEGARPALLRTDTLPVGLYERTERADAAEAELFVSIHNNALPDGIRPFGREGTSAYYYHAHSAELAAALQRGMLRAMGLRDLGIVWGNLAVLRAPSRPAALTEGAFMMLPAHEAALRTDEFQERYARGVAEGLEAFLRARADWQARED